MTCFKFWCFRHNWIKQTVYSIELKRVFDLNKPRNLIQGKGLYLIKIEDLFDSTLREKNFPFILTVSFYLIVGMDRPDFEDNQGRCAPGRLKRLQSFQVLLLRHALLNFPTVKRVVYSTCSMYPEENEMVIDEILGNIDAAYKLVPIKHLMKNQWMNFSSKDYKCGDNCLYARPDIDYSNGFFVAVFERNPEVPLPDPHRKKTMNGSLRNDAGEIVPRDDTNENSRHGKCKKKRNSREVTEVEDDNHIDEYLKNEILLETKINNEDKTQEEISDDVIMTQESLIKGVLEKKRRRKYKKDDVQEELNASDVGMVDDAGTIAEIQGCQKKKKKKKRKCGEESTECVDNAINAKQTHEANMETPENDHLETADGARESATEKSERKVREKKRTN